MDKEIKGLLKPVGTWVGCALVLMALLVGTGIIPTEPEAMDITLVGLFGSAIAAFGFNYLDNREAVKVLAAFLKSSPNPTVRRVGESIEDLAEATDEANQVIVVGDVNTNT